MPSTGHCCSSRHIRQSHPASILVPSIPLACTLQVAILPNLPLLHTCCLVAVLRHLHSLQSCWCSCCWYVIADAIVLSEPLAEYVLVTTQNYLRLYTVAHVVAADRTTCKRVSLPGVLQFASSFAAQGAPSLVCLLQLEGEVHLQVGYKHSIPARCQFSFSLGTY